MASLLSWFKNTTLCLSSQSKPILFESMTEVEEMADSEKRILFVYQDDVYDATSYMKKHPGGDEILRLSKGKMVDKLFDKYHYPKGDAPKIMKKYKIGSLKPDWHLPKDFKSTCDESIDPSPSTGKPEKLIKCGDANRLECN